MTQNSNQFSISKEKGLLTLLMNFNIFTCKVDADETETLAGGDPVKIKDVSGDVIVIEKADLATDDIFGFVILSTKKNAYTANQEIKIASRDCVMYMEASAAIARGACVQVDPSNSKVATAVGANKRIGKALDKAAASGDLIRVWIGVPVCQQPVTFLDLVDTPSSYTGSGEDTLKVNAGEDAVEFVTV